MANITIKEGGRAYPFASAKLRTRQSGGGKVVWVPESAITRDALSVTENGDYRAAAEALYAYSRVSVNVTQSDHVSGKGTDGNDYNYTVDPTTGQLVQTKIPSSIRVVTPPDYVGPYGEGAYISFDGLTVEALYADGSSAGMVPFNELVFPVTVAHYDQESQSIYSATSDLDMGEGAQPVMCSTSVYATSLEGGTDSVFLITGGKITASQRSNKYIDILGASSNPNDVMSSAETSVSLSSSYEHGGKIVYYAGWTLLNRYDISPNYPGMRNAAAGMVAWTMVYGDIEQTGGNAVPVQWPRTGDGLTLETQFYIDVVDIAPSEG